MTTILEIITALIIIIGFLAFIISVITQVIKGISVFAKLPTDFLVLILSMLLTFVVLIVGAQILNLPLIWYYFVGAFITAFLVDLVATSGWKTVAELAARYIKWKNDVIPVPDVVTTESTSKTTTTNTTTTDTAIKKEV